MPTYDGAALFGWAVRTKMDLNPSASQINEFFGVSGQQSLYGGARGRVFLIQAVFLAPDVATLSGQIATLLSYDDGIGRTFYHELWGTYPKVVFGKFDPGERVIGANAAFALPYKVMFRGLV